MFGKGPTSLFREGGGRSGSGATSPFALASAKVGSPPIAADADFEPANPPNQLSKLIIDYRLS
jgi:hypothetical protein